MEGQANILLVQFDFFSNGQSKNYDYLRKLFKKEMGITPLEYMTNLRMKKAEIMLTSMWGNSYTVSEIANHCGFEDALYFSRVFKKTFGCSPSVFAKQKTKDDIKA